MFTIEITYSLESDRDHTLEVKGTMTRYRPAIVSGPPDNWAPAEGGELEDLEIKLVYGKRTRPLPKKLADRIFNDDHFIQKVIDSLEEV